MSLPDLCIAPYEMGALAPDEPRCAPATYRVWVWSLLWGGYYLVRRVQTAKKESLLVARREKSSDSPLLQLVSDESNAASRLRKGLFYRTLYFDGEGHLISSLGAWHSYLLLWPELPRWISELRPKSEFFQVWKGPGFRRRLFSYGLRQRIFSYWWATVPDSQIEREVTEMLQDVEGECAVARRWVQMTERERVSYFCRVWRGTLWECEQLLYAILWSDPTWSDNLNWWIWMLYMDCSTSDDIVRLSEIANDDGTHTLSPRLRRLLEIVVEGFGLHRNLELTNKGKHYHYRIMNWSGAYWTIDVPIPTQHERLEARLHLRDWLQEKVAPEEIPALLGEQS